MQTEAQTVAQRYSRSDGVACRVIAGETLVVPVRSGVGDLSSIYTFNAVGTLIWEQLGNPGKKTVAELATNIQEKFEVEEAQALKDVTDFLNELCQAGLVICGDNSQP